MLTVLPISKRCGAGVPGEPPRRGGCCVAGVVAASCPHAMPPKSTVAKKDPAKKTQQTSGKIQDPGKIQDRAPATAKGKATKTSAKLKGAAAAVLAGAGTSGVRSPKGECGAPVRG